MNDAITEMIEREAAAAEAESPDEPEALLEVEAESDAPAEPASDAQMEEIGKQLDAEAKRHGKQVAKIMGDSMGDLVTCPLCVTPGFVTVIPPEDFDPEQREAVMLAMGENQSPQLQHHPRFTTCDLCDGLGVLETGARNELNYTVNCERCQSRGYVDPQEIATQAQAMRDATAPAPPPPAYLPVPPTPNGGQPADPANPPQPWYDYTTGQWKL